MHCPFQLKNRTFSVFQNVAFVKVKHIVLLLICTNVVFKSPLRFTVRMVKLWRVEASTVKTVFMLEPIIIRPHTFTLMLPHYFYSTMSLKLWCLCDHSCKYISQYFRCLLWSRTCGYYNLCDMFVSVSVSLSTQYSVLKKLKPCNGIHMMYIVYRGLKYSGTWNIK